MRTIDIRRHTMRRKPGAHLSADGINLAAFVGKQSGPFNLVVTSTIPRAIETAIAMGFEVDQTIDELGHLPDDVLDDVGWPKPFSRVAEAVASGGPGAKLAREQAALWRRIAEQVPQSQHALIITHGGVVELGAVASQPGAGFKTWGEAVGYCEGVRLHYDGDQCTVDILRLPEPYRLIAN